ncbi:MAG: hypothetical protein HY006_02660 [Candidatus Sungbacteria bacterium]|nr:hypothetical protein [Candidatus Sungbacteria bacterium]
MPDKRGFVIVLPEDEIYKQQLEEKLSAYEDIAPYRAPELKMEITCRITVLRELLLNGEVHIYKLADEMARTYHGYFNLNVFKHACEVIEDYLEEIITPR